MDSKKDIGMDVNQATISVAVMHEAGKVVMDSVIETKAGTILEFIRGCTELYGSPSRKAPAPPACTTC
jgi:hypothetical protein